MPLPRAHVDLDAVAANTRLLADRAAGRLMAVVKADGFGHGAVCLGRAALASGASALGVSGVTDALALRAVGITAPIFSWLNPVDADWRGAAAADVQVAVPSREHLEAVARAAPGITVHLHLDTGLARDGSEPEAWPLLCRAAAEKEHRGLLRVAGIMGQLACADTPGHPANAFGRARFAKGLRAARAAGLRACHRHLAATAATLTDPLSHHTLVRVGAGLVGIDPSGSTRLRPAMTLTAPVVETRRVGSGTPVGHGQAWVTDRPTGLALLPLGYADGLGHATSGCAEVLLGGRRRPVVGGISMEQIVVDTGDDNIASGTTATVFGPGDSGEPTQDEWAAWAGIVPRALVAGVGPRVIRTFDGATATRL